MLKAAFKVLGSLPSAPPAPRCQPQLCVKSVKHYTGHGEGEECSPGPGELNVLVKKIEICKHR